MATRSQEVTDNEYKKLTIKVGVLERSLAALIEVNHKLVTERMLVRKNASKLVVELQNQSLSVASKNELLRKLRAAIYCKVV